MKVVLDTNVLISAVLFGGKSREILLLGLSAKIKIAISQEILKELTEVLLSKKFQTPSKLIQLIIHEISEIAELVIVEHKLKIIKRDPDDNMILECALSAEADYIVSGDKDILDLKKFKNIKIVTPHEFLIIAQK